MLFSALLGLALIGVPGKQAALEIIGVLTRAVERVARFVVSLTPYGLFAIAAVVAGSRYEAEDALDRIQIDFEPLPVVATFEDAMSDGAPLVHDSVPKNVYFLGHRSTKCVRSAYETK